MQGLHCLKSPLPAFLRVHTQFFLGPGPRRTIGRSPSTGSTVGLGRLESPLCGLSGAQQAAWGGLSAVFLRVCVAMLTSYQGRCALFRGGARSQSGESPRARYTRALVEGETSVSPPPHRARAHEPAIRGLWWRVRRQFPLHRIGREPTSPLYAGFGGG